MNKGYSWKEELFSRLAIRNQSPEKKAEITTS
jgi:hypothetical protein